MPVESSLPSDRAAILAAARSVAVFSEEEVNTVEELFEGYLESPAASGYNFLSYREDEAILGFACWGPTPLSKGAIDLYWIATSAEAQGKGVARALFDGVVEAACRYLDCSAADVTLSKGLGARHWAAAAISRATNAVAVTVSQSNGTVRIFQNGEVVLRIEPLHRRPMVWKAFEYEPPATETRPKPKPEEAGE